MLLILIHLLVIHFHCLSQISAMHLILHSMYLHCWPFCLALLRESFLLKPVYVWLHLSHCYLLVSRVWRLGLSVAHCSLLPCFQGSSEQIYCSPHMCHRHNKIYQDVWGRQLFGKIQGKIQYGSFNVWCATPSASKWLRSYDVTLSIRISVVSNMAVLLSIVINFKHHVTQSI